MANYSVLKAAVQAVVKTNGNQEITGSNMQSTLISIINSLGTGYQFMGVATPSTSPGTPDYNVAYIGGAGTYANFGTSITVPVGSIGVFKYNGSWVKEQIALFAGIDDAPTQGSTSLITSGAVAELQQETTGVFSVNWWQGNINSSGKFSGIATRVTNSTSITEAVLVKCSGDVKIQYYNQFSPTTSPVTGGVLDTDYIHTDVTGTQAFEIVLTPNQNFPNTYITFRRSSANTDISTTEVAANVSIIVLGSIKDIIDKNGSFKGIAQTDTIPDLSNKEIYYLATKAGTYTNFGNIEVKAGEYCLLAYKNAAWSKIVITREELITVGKDNAVQSLIGYIDYATGELTTMTSGFFLKVYNSLGIKSISAYVGSNSTTNAQIAFYSTNEISTTSYLGAYSVQSIKDSNGNGRWYYTENIPAEAKIAVVYDRFLNVAESSAVVQVVYNYADYTTANSEAKINAIDKEVNGVVLENLHLVQGGYNSRGVPNTTPTRVRPDRMIAKTEAPFDLIVPKAEGRFYQLLRYSTLNDYSSYVDTTTMYVSHPQGMRITEDTFGNNAGITVALCANDDVLAYITPEEFADTRFVKTEGIVDDIISLQDDVLDLSNASKIYGNTEYYGKIQTLNITDEKHKLTSRLVCEHYYDEYPYTRKNQSMAIWDGKAFCFNDTSFADTDGFCVVIDVETGNVITRVTDIPSVLAGDNRSHLNAASFTDQYYQYGDKYPLLLLSRGDYASPYTERLCMYVFRITEPTTNNFVFTRIKTIYTPNNPLAICNPSWGYDSERRMIWGHLHSQDWRWGNNTYRKFNGQALYFVAPVGTEYICVSTVGEVAAASATITINLGGVTTTEQVSANSVFEKVLSYTPFESGCTYISLNQSAEAFTGQYVVFSCDANGNNRKEIKFESAIQGFVAPDLTDTSDYTVQLSEYTIPAYIDTCTFQGGSFANGKLFLPIQDYTTINKQPTDYTGHVCAVVNPVSGYIESIIKTDTLENEGCAIWNGKLYVSAHSGGGTGHTITFRLTEYSFD